MVIGRDAKDVPVESALDYVAAYTAGNDVSSRKLQRDPTLAGHVPQWGFSKGFDTFAPMGPCLVAAELIGDPATLHLKTIINGETRQDESVSDLLFNSAYLVSYLSQGTTLQKGSVIMTGTPGGKNHNAEKLTANLFSCFVSECFVVTAYAFAPFPALFQPFIHRNLLTWTWQKALAPEWTLLNISALARKWRSGSPRSGHFATRSNSHNGIDKQDAREWSMVDRHLKQVCLDSDDTLLR